MRPSSPAPSKRSYQSPGQIPVDGGRGQADWSLEGARHRLQHRSPIPERLAHEVGIGHGQHVEGDELGRGLDRQPVDPALGRMDPLLQGVESQPGRPPAR